MKILQFFIKVEKTNLILEIHRSSSPHLNQLWEMCASSSYGYTWKKKNKQIKKKSFLNNNFKIFQVWRLYYFVCTTSKKFRMSILPIFRIFKNTYCICEVPHFVNFSVNTRYYFYINIIGTKFVESKISTTAFLSIFYILLAFFCNF